MLFSKMYLKYFQAPVNWVSLAKTDQFRVYSLLIIYYQPHSPVNLLGCTRQIDQTHVISKEYTLDKDPCVSSGIIFAMHNTFVSTFWNISTYIRGHC